MTTTRISGIESPADYLAAHADRELPHALLSGGIGDPVAEQRVQTWLLAQADVYLPGWDDGFADLLLDDVSLEELGARVRDVLTPLVALAERTGARPWESSRATTDEIFKSRRSHPQRWLPLREAAAIFRRLDSASRSDRRQIGRMARARGAGHPAGKRRATTSRDDGEDGSGEPPPAPLDERAGPA